MNVYWISGNRITVRILDLDLLFNEIAGQLAKSHFNIGNCPSAVERLRTQIHRQLMRVYVCATQKIDDIFIKI